MSDAPIPAQFTPTGTTTLAAGAVSTSVAFPSTGTTLTALVINAGPGTAYLAAGNTSVVATSAGMPVLPGGLVGFPQGLNTTLAAISPSTAALTIQSGTGTPSIVYAEISPEADLGGFSVVASDGPASQTLADRFGQVINVTDQGAVGDLAWEAGPITIANGGTALTVAGAAFSAVTDIGKTIIVPAAGASGGALFAEIDAVVGPTLITLGTAASAALAAATYDLAGVAPLALGTGYVPGNTIVLAGGSPSVAATLQVIRTQVGTAAVNAGGTGGTPGAVTLTGTTGTGLRFQATGTISGGGVLTGALIVTVGGAYLANPAAVAAEPVTGGGLTGATVAITMGIETADILAGGAYPAGVPTTLTQASTSGSGTGATFTATWEGMTILYGTDNAAAINAALAVARAVPSLPDLETGQFATVVLPFGKYLVLSSINATGLANVMIDGQNSMIYGAVAGYAVLDGMGSRYLKVRDLEVYGDATLTPTNGIQIGRLVTFAAATDNNNFDTVAMSGYFSIASLYNRACESTVFTKLRAWNNKIGGYAVAQDGMSALTINSQFVTLDTPQYSRMSFNQNTFINADMRSATTPLFIANTDQHTWITSYGEGKAYGVEIFSTPVVNIQPTFDLHIEVAIADYFFTTAPAGPYQNLTPTLYSPVISNSSINTLASVFAADVGTYEVLIPNLKFTATIWQFPTTRLWDNPALYAVTGDFYTEDPTRWVVPNVFIGEVTLGSPAVAQSRNYWNLSVPTSLLIGTATGSLVLAALSAAPGNSRYIRFLSGALVRWDAGAGGEAESGANAGSNYEIRRYADSGAFIDIPFAINRASGGVSMSDSALIGPGMCEFTSGAGSPASVVSADPGALYLNSAGGVGTTLYVKQTGTGDTGWFAVA